MPVMTGFEAIPRIREFCRSKNISPPEIVILTAAHLSSEEKERLGCNHILYKPLVNPHELEDVVKTIRFNP